MGGSVRDILCCVFENKRVVGVVCINVLILFFLIKVTKVISYKLLSSLFAMCSP